LTENTAACIECGAIARADARYCETCGAPVMSAAAPPDAADGPAEPFRVFDSYGPAGATAAVTAVVSGPFWVSEPGAISGTNGTDDHSLDQARGDPAPAPSMARGPVIIPSPVAQSGAPAAGSAGISAAIPSVANARLALDRATAERSATDHAASDKPRSYREQYADTQFNVPVPAEGSGTPPPAGPLTAAENDPPWRRIGCLRVITVILGLNWLVPGVIGLVADGIIVRGGTPFGEAFPTDVTNRLQAIVTVVGIVHLVWILIGVKILVAPGRWSLGITGLCFFVGAIAILFGLSLVHDPAPSAIATVGAIVLVEVVLGLMAITAAQSID
jgi:hypothetical protein